MYAVLAAVGVDGVGAGVRYSAVGVGVDGVGAGVGVATVVGIEIAFQRCLLCGLVIAVVATSVIDSRFFNHADCWTHHRNTLNPNHFQ